MTQTINFSAKGLKEFRALVNKEHKSLSSCLRTIRDKWEVVEQLAEADGLRLEDVNTKYNEASTKFSIGRGELSVDASYYRIEKALEGLKRIADTMAENNYYETEESALRSQISYIEQEIDYLRTAMSRDCKSL